MNTARLAAPTPRPQRAVYDIKDQVMDWDSIQFPVIPQRPQTFTPMYLGHDFRPDFELDGTTYNSMTDWMRMQGQVNAYRTPVMYSGMEGFKEVNSVEVSENAENTKTDFNDRFRRSYTDLAHQIAYRYPNPGLPRNRTGAIGGTWRHIKEVLGHHGSRVCFVDGLVSVYDTERFSEALQPPLPYKGKLVHPPFAPTQTEFTNSKNGHSCNLPKLETDIERKLRLNAAPKHKGHYQFK